MEPNTQQEPTQGVIRGILGEKEGERAGCGEVAPALCPGQAHQPHHSLHQPTLSASCCSGFHPPPVVLKALASSHPLVPTAADIQCLSSHF
ncbi:hypothetical protein Pmani_019819 [Petrolisthes manimaculis]|uniref:Uncharacterized protein n=1 Tax=Petrolisthes manimaculis TaxID=1843537 RepID=A0AAE1PIV4_9EUCA|nr:hypothetical protein Pmani_019819 [Petrolisthes manimaculis]